MWRITRSYISKSLVVKYNNIAKLLNYIVEIQLVKKVNLVLLYWANILITFYSTLAEGFRLNNYKNALDLVKKNEGNLDDGDKIIDEHSVVIDVIEFDTMRIR